MEQHKEYLKEVVQDEEIDFDITQFEKESLAENEKRINELLKSVVSGLIIWLQDLCIGVGLGYSLPR